MGKTRPANVVFCNRHGRRLRDSPLDGEHPQSFNRFGSKVEFVSFFSPSFIFPFKKFIPFSSSLPLFPSSSRSLPIPLTYTHHLTTAMARIHQTIPPASLSAHAFPFPFYRPSFCCLSVSSKI